MSNRSLIATQDHYPHKELLYKRKISQKYNMAIFLKFYAKSLENTTLK